MSLSDINDFLVELATTLNTTQAIDDVKELERELKKRNIELNTVLNTSGNERVIQEFAVKIQKLFSDRGIDIDISKIVSSLNKVQSQAEAVANKVSKIKFSMDNGHGVSEYQNRINKLISDFERYGVASDKAKNETKQLQKLLSEMKGMPDDKLAAQADKIEKEFKAVKVSVDQAKLAYDKFSQPVSNEKVTALINRINTFLTKNTRITKESRIELEGFIKELSLKGADLGRYNEIGNVLKKTENSMRGLGRLGASFKNQMAQAAESFTQWISVSSGIMFLVSQTKNAITEIKGLDNTLTEISKTSNMSDQQLKQLGMDAYGAASRYGRVANDYLTGVQEMNRSGFYGKKGTDMAEQSLLAQSAGDMDRELADRYILSLNAAYKYNGEAEKINAALDGMNSITNKNSVAMADMAEAMTKVGTVAGGYRVKVEDLSAMIGTMESVTKLGGDEIGNAGKAILINLQNITSSKIVDTLNKANASMTEMVNGTEKLRDPISILRDLAKTYNQLDEDDPLRAEIVTNIGQKYHANKLSALLQNMELFDKMLVDYSEGEGSAFAEAEKSANNLTGTVNKLHNSWTEFVNSIVDSDELKTGVNFLNNLVKTFTSVTSSGENLTKTLLTIIGTVAQLKSKSGGLMRLNPIINKSPFLATVEFNSDVYDSYVCA